MYTREQNNLRMKIFNFFKSYNTKTDALNKFGRSKFVKQSVEEAIGRRANYSTIPTVRNWCDSRIRKRFDFCAEYLPDSGYSMGETKKITTDFFGVISSYNNCREYAKSCSYRARHGEVEVYIPLHYLRRLTPLDGTLFYKLKKSTNNVYVGKPVSYIIKRKRNIITDIKYSIKGRKYCVIMYYGYDIYDNKKEAVMAGTEMRLKAGTSDDYLIPREQFLMMLRRVVEIFALYYKRTNHFLYIDKLTEEFLFNIKKEDVRYAKVGSFRIDRNNKEKSFDDLLKLIQDYYRRFWISYNTDEGSNLRYRDMDFEPRFRFDGILEPVLIYKSAKYRDLLLNKQLEDELSNGINEAIDDMIAELT